MLIKISFWFTIITLLSFNVQEIDTATKKINVTGKALNTKAGAVVVTENAGTFFLDGIASWPDLYYNKRVEVSGKLKIVTRKKQSTELEIVAEWTGTRNYIKNPKWKLAK